ncbi:MAG: hypothetical protein H6734_20780 [Alphaproteobacteria bacterium]|nr:hypothetical protein [Alphaproteobacteria bacterium]
MVTPGEPVAVELVARVDGDLAIAEARAVDAGGRTVIAGRGVRARRATDA